MRTVSAPSSVVNRQAIVLPSCAGRIHDNHGGMREPHRVPIGVAMLRRTALIAHAGASARTEGGRPGRCGLHGAGRARLTFSPSVTVNVRSAPPPDPVTPA